jgi:hypothetical protein
MIVEGERVFVDGTVNDIPVRFWIDTGGGPLLFADVVGLDKGPPSEEDPSYFMTTIPEVAVAGYVLDTTIVPAALIREGGNIVEAPIPGHAEGFIPGRLLAAHHVIFDYPNRTMSIDTGVNDGTELPVSICGVMRFPRIEVEIGGTMRGFLLDVGASMTMIPAGSATATWERWKGAHGPATYFCGRVVETLVIPSLKWGPFEVEAVMCVSQPSVDKLLSNWMDTPIFGALGGNVLQHFKITIDYPNERLFVAR